MASSPPMTAVSAPAPTPVPSNPLAAAAADYSAATDAWVPGKDYQQVAERIDTANRELAGGIALLQGIGAPDELVAKANTGLEQGVAAQAALEPLATAAKKIDGALAKDPLHGPISAALQAALDGSAYLEGLTA